MANPLRLLPSWVRVALHFTYALGTLTLGGVLAGYAAVQITAPVWIVGTLAAANFVGSGLGFVATTISAPTVDAGIGDGDGIDYSEDDVEDSDSVGTCFITGDEPTSQDADLDAKDDDLPAAA